MFPRHVLTPLTVRHINNGGTHHKLGLTFLCICHSWAHSFCSFYHDISVVGWSHEYWWSVTVSICLFSPIWFFLIEQRRRWVASRLKWLLDGNCAVRRMQVGLGAAEAIWKVHGQNYEVGTPPDICRCKHFSLSILRLKDSNKTNNPFRPLLWFIPRLGTYAGDPFYLHFWAKGGVRLPASQGSDPANLWGDLQGGHVITYAHDKTFNGATVTTAATLWTLLLAVGIPIVKYVCVFLHF